MLLKSIMAFDFGMKNIGMAIGQCITCTAQPLSTCKVRNGIPNWKQIESLLKEWKPDILVVGLPLNMNGSMQLITIQAKNFACQLYIRFHAMVVLHDERLSTVEARAEIFKHGGYHALKKNQIDTWSAVIILESWLQQNAINFI